MGAEAPGIGSSDLNPMRIGGTYGVWLRGVGYDVGGAAC
jgi:hypothetical protein